jgi:hypothetical protein
MELLEFWSHRKFNTRRLSGKTMLGLVREFKLICRLHLLYFGSIKLNQ